VADITEFVRPGEAFDLAIQVIGHRRNSHGPFHLRERWPVWTGPGEYVKENQKWQDEYYSLVPCGLMAEPEIEITQAGT